MNQVLYILRKDIRRQRLEIAASLLLLLAFAWKSPMVWNNDTDETSSVRLLFGVVGVALILSWWFLIIRVVQGESLVGDRQFWLTRPYRRHSLLLSKVLFIFLFVNLPVFIFDIAALHHAGFAPWQHGAGLLQGQLLLTAFLIVPIATISAFTETIAQVLLVFLGLIVFFVGLNWITDKIPSSSFGSNVPGGVVIIILACVCVAVLALQYFRRDTRLSRFIVLGSLCVIALILIAAPYNRLIEHAYPKTPDGPFTAIRAAVQKSNPKRREEPSFYNNKVSLTTAMKVDGLADGSLVVIDAARLSIFASNGRAWNTGWVGSSRTIWSNSSEFREMFAVDKNFYSSVASDDVRLRVELAVSQYHEHFLGPVTVAATDFRVTNDGICSGADVRVFRALRCRAALNEPAFTAQFSPLDTTCTLPDASWPSLQVRRYDAAVSAEFGGGAGVVPIHPFDINFGEATDPSGKKSVFIICPGTKFDLAKPVHVGQYRVESEVQAVRLPDYLSTNDFDE
jgi:hypothetical protein